MEEPSPPGRLHPDLRSGYRRTLLGALLIFAIPGSVVLVLVAARSHKTGQDLSRSALDAFAGLVLLVAAWLLIRSAVWMRRCSAVYYERRPVPMTLRLVRRGRASLQLELHALSAAEPTGETTLRIQAQSPSWDTSDLEGAIVGVRVDEDPRGPVVVETARGVLWPAALGRRVRRAAGRLG